MTFADFKVGVGGKVWQISERITGRDKDPSPTSTPGTKRVTKRFLQKTCFLDKRKEKRQWGSLGAGSKTKNLWRIFLFCFVFQWREIKQRRKQYPSNQNLISSRPSGGLRDLWITKEIQGGIHFQFKSSAGESGSSGLQASSRVRRRNGTIFTATSKQSSVQTKKGIIKMPGDRASQEKEFLLAERWKIK